MLIAHTPSRLHVVLEKPLILSSLILITNVVVQLWAYIVFWQRLLPNWWELRRLTSMLSTYTQTLHCIWQRKMARLGWVDHTNHSSATRNSRFVNTTRKGFVSHPSFDPDTSFSRQMWFESKKTYWINMYLGWWVRYDWYDLVHEGGAANPKRQIIESCCFVLGDTSSDRPSRDPVDQTEHSRSNRSAPGSAEWSSGTFEDVSSSWQRSRLCGSHRWELGSDFKSQVLFWFTSYTVHNTSGIFFHHFSRN